MSAVVQYRSLICLHRVLVVLWILLIESWCCSCNGVLILTPEKEKVEGEELQEWLRMVVAPKELSNFVAGRQEALPPVLGSLLPLQGSSG